MRDDILDSLNRQTHPYAGPVEEETVQRVEGANFMQHKGEAASQSGMAGAREGRHAGRLAFLVFAGGFLAVWLYGYLTKAYEIPYLSTVLQNLEVQIGIQTVSAYPIEAGMVSAGVLLTALFIRHRRKKSSS